MISSRGSIDNKDKGKTTQENKTRTRFVKLPLIDAMRMMLPFDFVASMVRAPAWAVQNVPETLTWCDKKKNK